MSAHREHVGRVPSHGAAPKGRKKIAQGKERSDAALGHESQNTSRPDAGSGDPAYNATRPTDVGRVPPRSESPEEAKAGGWAVVPLGEVVDVNPRPDSDELHNDSLASFIPMKCVEAESGQFQPLGDRKVGEVRKGYTPFRDGDVIFAKVTPCMENGKAAVMKGLTNGMGFGSTEFFALRPKECLDASYLFHFILQSSFRRQAAQNMTGAVGLRRVPKSYLEQQPIPLPPLPEQRRIVAEIEKQFTRLEAGVAALRRVQANLKRYRAAVLKAACAGQLVPTEAELVGRVPSRGVGRTKTKGNAAWGHAAYNDAPFETGEQLLKRILAERRQHWEESYRKSKIGNRKYVEPAAPDTANLPPLPAGWTWASGAQLFAWSSGEGLTQKDIQPGDYPVYGGNGVTGHHNAFVAENPTIVIGRVGALCGNVCLTKGRAWITDNAIYATQTPSAVSMKFVEIVFSQAGLNKRAAGSGQPFVNQRMLNETIVPLPPFAEQTRIVAEVERRLSVVEELESVVSANLQRATRLRQSILQNAFTGKLA